MRLVAVLVALVLAPAVLAATRPPRARAVSLPRAAVVGKAWRAVVAVTPPASGMLGPLSFIGVMQPVTRTRLTEATGLPRTTQRDVIRRLLDRGHVRELPNPRDGRSTLLEPTPGGQAIFDQGKPAFLRALRRIDGALDGRLDEHEEVVWKVRVALQGLVGEWSA